MRRRTIALAAAAVFLVSLALRLGFVWETRDVVVLRTPNPLLDAHVALEAARGRAGDAPSAPGFAWRAQSAPLHPTWLALQVAVMGEDVERLRVASAVWSSLRMVLVLLAMLRLVRRAWPAIAGTLLLSCLPSLVYFDTALLKASLDVTLSAFVVWLAIERHPPSSRLRAWGRGAAMGAFCGLALLCQLAATPMVIVVALAVWLRRTWPRGIRLRTIGAAVAVSVLAAVTAASRPGDLVPRAGLDLAIAQQADEGIYRRLPDVHPTPLGHAYEGRMAAELRTGRRMGWSEADDYWRGIAWQTVRRDPGGVFARVATKIRLALHDRELRGVDYLPHVALRSTIASTIPVSFAWLVALGAAGAVALAQRRRWSELTLLGGLIGAQLLVLALTFVNARYRLPMVLPLAMLSAAGLDTVGEWIARWRTGLPVRSLLGVALALLAGAAVAAAPPPADLHEEHVAEAAGSARRSAAAEETGRLLAALENDGARSPADRMRRVRWLVDLHRHDDAFAELEGMVPVHTAGLDERTRDMAVWIHARWLYYLVWLDRYDDAVAFVDTLHGTDPEMARSVAGWRHGTLHDRTLARFVLPRTALMPGRRRSIRLSGPPPRHAPALRSRR